jgi:hypothetical protein
MHCNKVMCLVLSILLNKYSQVKWSNGSRSKYETGQSWGVQNLTRFRLTTLGFTWVYEIVKIQTAQQLLFLVQYPQRNRLSSVVQLVVSLLQHFWTLAAFWAPLLSNREIIFNNCLKRSTRPNELVSNFTHRTLALLSETLSHLLNHHLFGSHHAFSISFILRLHLTGLYLYLFKVFPPSCKCIEEILIFSHLLCSIYWCIDRIFLYRKK